MIRLRNAVICLDGQGVKELLRLFQRGELPIGPSDSGSAPRLLLALDNKVVAHDLRPLVDDVRHGDAQPRRQLPGCFRLASAPA